MIGERIEFLPHQFPENIICTVKYFSPASEVPVKINSLPAYEKGRRVSPLRPGPGANCHYGSLTPA